MFRRFLLAAPILLASCAQPGPMSRVVTTNVFFTADSAALDSSAQAAIGQAAAAARGRPNATVQVEGFAAATGGSAAFNQSLAATRAHAVEDALVQAGVPRSQILLEPRGAAPFDLMPTESRRVTIVVG